MSIAVVMTTLYSPVIESILFGFLELAIHHNCMTVYGCMVFCSKSHMNVIYIVRAFTLILVISCHFMFFSNEWMEKKTNTKREKYLQNAERQANERRKKICARKIATFTMTLTDAQKSLERARKQNECVQYFFFVLFLLCVCFLFWSAALMLCSGDWYFIYTVCSMVVSNGFITCSYQCMYPFAICVHCSVYTTAFVISLMYLCKCVRCAMCDGRCARECKTRIGLLSMRSSVRRQFPVFLTIVIEQWNCRLFICVNRSDFIPLPRSLRTGHSCHFHFVAYNTPGYSHQLAILMK